MAQYHNPRTNTDIYVNNDLFGGEEKVIVHRDTGHEQRQWREASAVQAGTEYPHYTNNNGTWHYSTENSAKGDHKAVNYNSESGTRNYTKG
jgi:hypothetical protein